MATAPADFAKWVRPFVPECPEVQMADSILQACIEFCERTRVATEDVQITTSANDNSYTIPVTSSYEPVSIEFVKFDGYSLTASDKRTIDLKLQMSCSEPREYYLDENQNLIFWPTPEDVETLDVSVAVAPKITSTIVPDCLMLNRRYQAIAAKACSLLHDMVGVPWTNPGKAAEEGAIFEAAVAREKSARLTGHGKKRMRSRAQFF